MRRMVWLVALVLLVTEPAHADPISAAIGAVATFFGASAATAAAFGAAALNAIGNIVIGLAVTAIASKFVSRPKGPDVRQQQGNIVQPVMPMERCYGRVRKGGPVGLTRLVKGPNGRIFNVILAAHEIDAVEAMFFDDRQLTLGADGKVVSEPFDQAGSSDALTVDLFLGGSGQAANSRLVNRLDDWTEDHDMAGLAYATVFCKAVSDQTYNLFYPQPQIATPVTFTALLRGRKLYDPRSGQTVWTNNAALVMAAEAVFQGLSVDWDAVAIEADVCDELVTNAQGETQPRWTINMVVSDDMSFGDVREQMALACDAYWYQGSGGVIGFRVGRYIPTNIALVDRDFHRITISDGETDNAAPSELVARYVEPDNAHRETPSGAILVDPDAPLNRREVNLLSVDSHNQAVRVLIREGKKARPDKRIAATCTLAALELMVDGTRFVRVRLEETGFDEIIEISRLDLIDNRSRLYLEGHTVQETDFATAIIEPPRPVLTAPVVEPSVVEPPGNVAVALIDRDAATPVTEIRVTWDAADDSYDHEIRTRVKMDPEEPWQSRRTGFDRVDSTSDLFPDRIQFRDVAAEQWTFAGIDGLEYEIQVASVSSAGVMSAWTPEVPLSVRKTNDQVAPDQIVSVDAEITENNETLLNILPPGSSNFASVRIFKKQYAKNYTGSFEEPSLEPTGPTGLPPDFVASRAGLPGTRIEFLDPLDGVLGPEYGVFAYWVEARNASNVGAEPLFGPTTVENYDPAGPPDPLSAVAASPGVGRIDWTGMAPTWANFSGVRVYRGPDADFANASVESVAVDLPAAAAFDVEIPAASGSGQFWLVPLSLSGVAGSPSGPFNLTVV